MKRQRRRVLKAALAVLGTPAVPFRGARAQDASGRNLNAREAEPRTPPQGPSASSAALLLAPRKALVIGNSAYDFGALKNPANDARAIGAELERTGFEVTLGIDLPRARMLEAIDAYGRAVEQTKAIGLFYFAGHGVQLAWRNYLLPTDATLEKIEDIQAKCVDVNSLVERIGKAANPMNVIILDACRDNPFAHEGKIEQKGLSQVDAPPGTLIAYATAPGNVASDGEGANGLYTENLLRELLVPEAKIEDVFKRVRLAVRRRSKGLQIPWESTSLEEDFWFIPPRELKRLADEEAERLRREREAERLRKEKEAEAERARKQAEAEKRAEAEKQAELERIRREQAEAERIRREQAEAERRKLEQLALAAQEQLKRRQREQAERAYKEELSLWERVSKASEPAAIEEYLRRYPSGYFAEIAQAQLDHLLKLQGEKKIEIVPQTQNPYTQGSASANTDYRVGDSYTYQSMDLYSKVVGRSYTNTITSINDREVIYNDGQFITDLLGNPIRQLDGRRSTPNQIVPLDYSVGKRWSTRFNTEHPQFGLFEVEVDLRIAARERITVPAGTFDTFRIEAVGGASGGPGLVQMKITTWMAPSQVRRPIAREELRTAGGGRKVINAERLELTAYRQS